MCPIKLISFITRNNFFTTLAGLFILLNLNAQQLKIYNINTSRFPDITANFALYDAHGEFIYDLVKEEVQVIENSRQRQIIEFYNPSRSLLHSSIVLMLDISKSMTGERLQMLKDAAVSFVDTLPLDITEVAIGTFNNEVYLNCDFTQKKERLRKTIQLINADGETDYNNAFMNIQSGAMNIASHGFYKKKIVIFLTDGLAGANVAEIAGRAQSENIAVYCISVQLKMPFVLKRIAEETGGDWFEEVNTYEKSREIYDLIFEHAQSSTFGYIRWRSSYTCNPSVALKLIFRGISNSLTYDIPVNKRGRLETGASALYFSKIIPGVRNELATEFSAKNIPITVTGLLNNQPDYFGFEKTDFPFVIPKNQSVQFRFYYIPVDSGMRTNTFTISTKECGDLRLNAYGGSENKINLLYPAGDEIFVPGMDTMISWEGVEKDINVLLTVKNESKNCAWTPITVGTGLNYRWNVPGDTGSRVRIKAATLTELNKKSNLLIRTRINGDESPFYSVNYSPDGSEIYTCDSSGIIKIWNENNGQLLKKLDQRSRGYIVYSPQFDRLISLSESGISLFTNRTGMYIGHVGSPGKRLYTPVLCYDGTEYYSTASQDFKSVTPVEWKTGKNSGIWDPFQKIYLNLPENKVYTESAFSSSRLFAITLQKDKLSLWNITQKKIIKKFEFPANFTSALFAPGKNILALNTRNSIILYDIDKKKNLFKVTGEEYVQFSPKGKYIISRTDSIYNLRRLNNLNLFISIALPKFLKFSDNENNLLYARCDTVFIHDLKKDSICFRKYFPSLQNVILNGSEKKILIYNSNSIEIINWPDNKIVFRATFGEDDFRSFVFSPQNENILSITSDNEAVVWKPILKAAEDSSGYFMILSPKPSVKDTIFFGEQFLNKPEEKIIEDYLKNSYKFPVKIENIKIKERDSSEFEIVSEIPPYRINPHSTKDIELRFVPKKEGVRYAIMQVSAPTDTFNTILIGNGKKRKFEIPSKTIDFGTIKLFTEKDTLVSIFKNLTMDTIYFKAIENSGPDTDQFKLLTYAEKLMVPPEKDLNLAIKFAPMYRGRTNGQFKLILQNSNEYSYIRLYGEGKSASEIFVFGISLDSKDSLPLEVNIKCIDLETNRVVVDTSSAKDGKFGFYVRPDRVNAIIGEKEGYFSSSENLDLSNTVLADTIYRNIFLAKTTDQSMVRLNNIFFEFAKADLLETSFGDLNRILILLRNEKEINIEIHGHTDNIGSEENNLVLARERAMSVKNFLVSQGIDKNRLNIQSFGESKPVATNDTDEGRQLNRRVEIKILSFNKQGF